ncbi:MAG: hypothetical protein ACKOB4_03420, partial [Acidobacteriota bacterium]
MLLFISGLTMLAMLFLGRRIGAGIKLVHHQRLLMSVFSGVAFGAVMAGGAMAQTGEVGHTPGGEANLKLPDLTTVSFLGGTTGQTLLTGGLIVCGLGLLFGLLIYTQLKKLPVHQSMREISELIYETCKTYLITQGKFILMLEAFIGVIIINYFGVVQELEPSKVLIILLF